MYNLQSTKLFNASRIHVHFIVVYSSAVFLAHPFEAEVMSVE